MARRARPNTAAADERAGRYGPSEEPTIAAHSLPAIRCARESYPGELRRDLVGALAKWEAEGEGWG
jgi:hypothetical protein